jgi:hypothetical protein
VTLESDITQRIDIHHEREISPNVVIWNVADEMQRHQTRRYARRNDVIRRIYVHHSGALGKPGIMGAFNSSRYDVTYGKPPFPGPAYHLWIPYSPLLDSKGRKVVLRMNADTTASWHTGGTANQHGLGVCFQGDHSGGKNGLPLSDFQTECASALLPHLISTHGETIDHEAPVAWHAVAQHYSTSNGKPSCPGAHTVAWLTEWLDSAGHPRPKGIPARVSEPRV